MITASAKSSPPGPAGSCDQEDPGDDHHRKQPVHLAEHELVAVELGHQHERDQRKEPGGSVPRRQQPDAQRKEHRDQGHG